MFVFVFYGIVVTEFKDLDTVTKTVSVPTTFTQVPAETDTSCSLKGIGESRNSEIVKQHKIDHIWCTKRTEVLQKSEGALTQTQDLYLQCNKIIYKVENKV